MNFKSVFLTGVLLFFFSAFSFSQADWTLKLNKDGIKVYTKNLDNSPFKAIKTICTLQTTLSRLAVVLLDIKGGVDWVYATKKCDVLKQISPLEYIYYSEIEVPWPASNRDFIVRVKLTQDEKTKAITVDGENKPGYLPENKNIVRIQRSDAKWFIVPLPNGQVRVEYILQVDPGGNVPSWLINMFATRGPYESFRNLREQVKKATYNNMNLPAIKN